MTDYTELLTEAIPYQFRDREKICVLISALGRQMNELAAFFEQIRGCRNIDGVNGAQLDGLGDVLCLTRGQVTNLSPIPIAVLADEEYRKYLKYKILFNSSGCTYNDLMAGLSMFFDDHIEYEEDPQKPASFSLKAGADIAAELAAMPFIRAAGVNVTIIPVSFRADYTVVPMFGLFINDVYTVQWTN